MRESTKTALAVVVVIALAVAFWMLLLAPKKDKAGELSERTEALSGEVAAEQQKASIAKAAKAAFPHNYRELVLLGKAVPAEAATPSLMVQLGGAGAAAHTNFQAIIQKGEEGETSAVAGEGATGLTPIGSTTGPAGFLSMPYTLEFEGGFFQLAGFIHRLDSLVQTKGATVDAEGRLITVDGFNLTPVTDVPGESGQEASGRLKANLTVSTYVTPPDQGLTAGATPAGPASTTPDLP